MQYEPISITAAPAAPAESTGYMLPLSSDKIQDAKNIFLMRPHALVGYAKEIAEVLIDVIEKQQLYTLIKGKKYVRVEGWCTLGALLGILPIEDRVQDDGNGSFEARVKLVRIGDGVVVGGASSICGTDESSWKNRDKFARRSMAITRATGKAYRLGFAWIMSLAGYEPTPAEEMVSETSATTFIGTKEQRLLLFNLLQAKKIFTTEEMKACSKRCEGVAMDTVKDIVDDYYTYILSKRAQNINDFDEFKQGEIM